MVTRSVLVPEVVTQDIIALYSERRKALQRKGNNFFQQLRSQVFFASPFMVLSRLWHACSKPHSRRLLRGTYLGVSDNNQWFQPQHDPAMSKERLIAADERNALESSTHLQRPLYFNDAATKMALHLLQNPSIGM